MRNVFVLVVLIAVLAALGGGGYRAWKHYTIQKQRALEAETLGRLKAAVAETENHRLPRNLENDDSAGTFRKAIDARKENAEKFLKEANEILQRGGYRKLDKDFQDDFKNLTVFTRSDAYNTLKLLKFKDKLAAAATVAEFCDAVKNADLPLETKEKLMAKYFSLAVEGDSAAQYGWKLRKAIIAKQRKQHEEDKTKAAALKTYLDGKIRELQNRTFDKVRGQLSVRYHSWEDFERRGKAEDKTVLQYALEHETIGCFEFGLSSFYSFPKLVRIQEETAERLKKMRFIPQNKKLFRGDFLFPGKNDHPLFATENGCLIDRTNRKLLYVIPTKDGKYTLPADVKSAEKDAFCDFEDKDFDFIMISPTRVFRKQLPHLNEQEWGMLKDWELVRPEKLQEIVIPDGTTELDPYIFLDCRNLVSVTIPSGVTAIGEGAFWDCDSLKEIILPPGLISIDARAFFSSGLTSIVIPDGVRSIGNLAFAFCKHLERVTLPWSIASIGKNAFADCPCERYVRQYYPTQDFDGDGVSNWHEYLLGTDPADKDSFPSHEKRLYLKSVVRRTLPVMLTGITAVPDPDDKNSKKFWDINLKIGKMNRSVFIGDEVVVAKKGYRVADAIYRTRDKQGSGVVLDEDDSIVILEPHLELHRGKRPVVEFAEIEDICNGRIVRVRTRDMFEVGDEKIGMVKFQLISADPTKGKNGQAVILNTQTCVKSQIGAEPGRQSDAPFSPQR